MIGFAGYLNYIDGKKPDDAPNTAMADEGGVNALILDDLTGQEVAVIRTSPMDGITGTALTGGESDFTMIAEGELSEAENSSGETEPGTAVFVNLSNDSSFFVQAKLEREQASSRDRETLMQLINNTNLEKDQRADYAKAILNIQERIEKETAAESMIEAKGFTEAYVRIDENGVDVVVSKKVLSDAEIAQIEDIIKRKTGFSADKIKISPLKG
jgi:stage III sporulation protein AH